MKHCLVCTRCGADRAVAPGDWERPPPCRSCKRSSCVEDQLQLDKYKKHFQLLTAATGQTGNVSRYLGMSN